MTYEHAFSYLLADLIHASADGAPTKHPHPKRASDRRRPHRRRRRHLRLRGYHAQGGAQPPGKEVHKPSTGSWARQSRVTILPKAFDALAALPSTVRLFMRIQTNASELFQL